MLIKFLLKQISLDSSETIRSITEIVFEGGLLTIGSDAGSTIVLSDSAPEQAVIVREGENLTLINSSEGTIVNGRNLRREALEPLTDGDEIRVGNYVIQVAAGQTANGNLPSRTDFENSTDPISFSPVIPAALIDDKHENLVSAEKITNGVPEIFESAIKNPTRNFADVLNALRTEEDSFYFTLTNGAASDETRVPIEQSEMPIGLNASGQITCAAEQIAALYAIVKKDWSGIVVESQRGAAVFINGEPIKTVVRLRNGDRLTFDGARKQNKPNASLELHEPSSLVALESILETRSRSENPYRNPGGTGNFAAPVNHAVALTQSPNVSVFERDFFGYFSFFEVVTMAIGTLIAAVLIFLVLEFTV